MYRLTLACISLGLASAVLAQNPLPTDRQAGADAVTDANLREWLGTLASPEFEGRGTGQEGFRKAAEYVRGQFEALGLRPGAGDGSYWQRVPWGAVVPDLGATALIVRGPDGASVMSLDGSGLSGRISGPQEGTGALTVLVVRDLQDSGIDGLDLSGRMVLVYVHPDAQPAQGGGAIAAAGGNRGGAGQRRGGGNRGAGQARGAGNRGAGAGAGQRRGGGNRGRGRRGGGGATLNEATAAGAAVVLSVLEEAPGQGLTGTSGSLTGGRGGGGAQLSIAKADLERILRAAGQSADILNGDQLRTDLSGFTGELRVAANVEDLPAWNVVGILPGSDPQLRDEYVVVGSHLDHNGIRNGTIYPGADDDGSGSTGVIAVAKAFSSNPLKPRRSILFVEFCGEENGLVGSGYFADNAPIPLSSIVGELQMDMIGRNEGLYRGSEETFEENLNTLHLVGTEKLSRDLHYLCMSRNWQYAGFDLEFDEEDVFFRSDHANFAKYGVPIAFFFTGFHPDYHQPSDTPDKINYPKLKRVAMYVYDLAFELAQSDSRPMIDPQLWEENRVPLRSPVEKPAAPIRGGK